MAYNSKCNLACPFCFTDAGQKSTRILRAQEDDSGPLQSGELKDLINQSEEFGAKSVCFWGEGEPLLDDEDVSVFFDLVDHVNNRGLDAVVFTNGTMVNEEIARTLFAKNVSVVGKLYSLTRSTNEFLTGNKGVYTYVHFGSQEVPSHIVSLANAGYLGTDRFALHTVVTAKNHSEIEDIWRWERETGIIPYVDFLYTYEDKDLDISDSGRTLLCKAIHELDTTLGYDYEFRVGPHIGHRICNTRVALSVGVNGDVRICPATYVSLGNVRKQSLKDILARRPEIEERHAFKCEDRERCGAYRLEERGTSGGSSSLSSM